MPRNIKGWRFLSPTSPSRLGWGSAHQLSNSAMVLNFWSINGPYSSLNRWTWTSPPRRKLQWLEEYFGRVIAKMGHEHFPQWLICRFLFDFYKFNVVSSVICSCWCRFMDRVGIYACAYWLASESFNAIGKPPPTGLPYVTQTYDFWLWYHLLDSELSIHLKPIGVKKYTLKLFMTFNIVPRRFIFKTVAKIDIIETPQNMAFARCQVEESKLANGL